MGEMPPASHSSDLPPALAWPEWNGIALTFIAQFRMDDITPFEPEELLPATSILYFFYAADEQRGGCIEDLGAGRVVHFDGDLSVLSRRPSPLNIPEEMGIFNPCALSFSTETILPGLQWGLVEKLWMDEADPTGSKPSRLSTWLRG